MWSKKIYLWWLTFNLLVSSNASLRKKNSILRPKRNDNIRNKACELLIAIDEPLYKKYGEDASNLTSLVKTYVQDLNNIYARTLLKSDSSYGKIYFRIKEIRILFDFCTECNSTQKIFLNEFSTMNFQQFCLAHVFTYRDFPDGVQGLAWKSTICKTKYNTGFTTLLNHQVDSSVDESVKTFAHEIGHNLGSHHDEDAGCSSNYIMSESGTTKRNPSFSKCSLTQMRAELDQVLENPRRDCFVDKPENEDPDDFSFCGDEIVSGYEECDCGMDYRSCTDPCCYAARIDPWDLYYNKSATPCRRNSRESCLHPWKSFWLYGFIGPWIIMAVLAVGLAVILMWDWKHSRMFFHHIVDAKELIRSETADQIARRKKRNSSEKKPLQNVFTLANESSNNDLAPSAPPRPSVPPVQRTNQQHDDIVEAIKAKFQKES